MPNTKLSTSPSCVHKHSPKATLWLCGASTAFSCTARAQAADLFPAFIEVFADAPEITAAIDQGRPFLSALAEVTEISAPVLKRLRGKSVDWLGEHQGQLSYKHFCGLDENDFPESVEDAQVLYADSLMKSAIAKNMDLRSPHLEPVRWDSVPGRPKDMMLLDGGGSLEWMRDGVFSVAHYGVLPHFVRTGRMRETDDQDRISDGLIFALYQTLGISGAVRLSRKWHNALPEIDALAKGDVSQVTWSPFIGSGTIAGTQIQFKEICSYQDLIELGRDQKHCVGSYIERVLDESGGLCVIVKLHADEQVLSTVQFMARRSFDGEELTIVQEQGYNNMPPSPDARDAAERLIPLIKDAFSDMDHLIGYISGLDQAYGAFTDAQSHTSDAEHAFLVNLLPANVRSDEGLDALLRTAREHALSSRADEPMSFPS